ncbi:hypothetical protein LEP1GSC161_3006 [Leptospira santarosai str. CBC1416]|uniref:Uncharacterized protein n=1 Tax=Leptospira santarosai str. CBC1416 TaxID=1193059 RepID=M6VQ24_9LEPT|nr:hypothetical protein LEP1GSC161_3006 [Leptospira santarosai str. CBC1416]
MLIEGEAASKSLERSSGNLVSQSGAIEKRRFPLFKNF